MSLTSARLDGTLLHMSEQGNTLSYALTPNLGRSAKSVAVKRYSAQMKSTGTFGDEELQEALASESKVSVEQIRYLEAVRRRIIENALRDGKKVFVNALRAGRRVPGRRGRPRGRGQVTTR